MLPFFLKELYYNKMWDKFKAKLKELADNYAGLYEMLFGEQEFRDWLYSRESTLPLILFHIILYLLFGGDPEQ